MIAFLVLENLAQSLYCLAMKSLERLFSGKEMQLIRLEYSQERLPPQYILSKID